MLKVHLECNLSGFLQISWNCKYLYYVGWKREGSNCYWIKKQLEPFTFDPQVLISSPVIHNVTSASTNKSIEYKSLLLLSSSDCKKTYTGKL